MKRRYVFILAMIIFVALIFFSFFSTFHHGTHCSDISCEICAQIQSIKKIIQGLFVSISSFAVLAVPIYSGMYIFYANESSLEFFTPVILKVKLSN